MAGVGDLHRRSAIWVDPPAHQQARARFQPRRVTKRTAGGLWGVRLDRRYLHHEQAVCHERRRVEPQGDFGRPGSFSPKRDVGGRQQRGLLHRRRPRDGEPPLCSGQRQRAAPDHRRATHPESEQHDRRRAGRRDSHDRAGAGGCRELPDRESDHREVDQCERGRIGRQEARRGGGDLVHVDRWAPDSRLDRQATGLRSFPEVSHDARDPRRPQWDVFLRHIVHVVRVAALCRHGIRRPLHQSAGQLGLWQRVRQRDQERVPGQGLRRPDERGR